MRAKLHLPALAFVAGGALARLQPLEQSVLGAICVCWLLFFYRDRALLVVLASSIIFGYFYLKPPVPPPSISPSFSSSVMIQSIDKSTSNIQLIVVEPEKNEKTLVSFFPEDESVSPASWRYGAACEIKGERALIEGATNPGQFNYKRYMSDQGVFAQVVLTQEEQLVCTGEGFYHKAHEFRERLITDVRRSLAPNAFPWIAALVFGEQDDLDEETVEWFRSFNLSHILAISGLHVGLFIAGVYWAIVRLGIGTIEQARTALLICLPSYAFLAGAAPSVLRASLMAVLLILFSFFRLRVPLTDVLSMAAVLLLLLSPTTFSSIGFQFSFLATFSLVLSKNILSQTQNVLVQSTQISLISQLAILPFQLQYFYEFNPLSLVANVILVPYFSFFVIPCGLLLVLSALLYDRFAMAASHFLADLHLRVLAASQWVMEPLEWSWVVGKLPPLFILLALIPLFYMMREWSKKHLMKAWLGGCAMVLVLVLYGLLPYASGKGAVTMLDVGQGDAFVIELPHRKGVLMVDAAGPPPFIENQSRTADDIIIPFLKSKGIAQLDALIVSHEDSDHNGSIPYVMDAIEVHTLIVHPYYQVEEEGVSVMNVEAGQRLEVKGHAFQFLHPSLDEGNPNDNSLVFTTTLGGLSWLFSGDISSEVEKEIIKAFPNVRVDVLKAAHHGSDTSSSEEWIDQLEPKVTWISAGRNNRYGHPHPSVVSRFQDVGITMYQTPHHGAVTYLFSGQIGTFSPFLPYNAPDGAEAK
ncbi:DNA internalization-related competence protein ComEC/Rec2 [Halobacillus litoralis]|uniref:DNA internalization-related competence protein ComEC/Rec2 n=1 Tax=Halobacillus litoralis TaxID=45668 RepID=UPI001CD76A74|nr:DNA internalization-related competence protein ComEC/Rec2 [Halobacillus litoralis]MCA0970017.1 DNA internalization-related competence protein ComEC/Rec2 [Halobacillus litoralis]